MKNVVSVREMFLNKEEIRKLIEEEGMVEDYIDLDMQLQPAGIDLTVDNISRFATRNYLKPCREGCVDFDNSKREIPKTLKLGYYTTFYVDSYGNTKRFYFIKPGSYKIEFNEKINLPKNIVGIGRTRSTLLRCGATISSGVWDPGYSGHGQVLLTVGAPLKIYKNARVFQLQFMRCNSTEKYDGIYQEK